MPQEYCCISAVSSLSSTLNLPEQSMQPFFSFYELFSFTLKKVLFFFLVSILYDIDTTELLFGEE